MQDAGRFHHTIWPAVYSLNGQHPTMANAGKYLKYYIYIWFSTCCALISIDRNYLWMLIRGSHGGSNYCRVPCHTNFLQEEWPRSSGSESALVPDPLGHKRVDDEVYFSWIVEIRWTSTWITGLSFFRGSFCGRSKIGNSYAKKDIEDWQPRRGRPMAEPYDHKPELSIIWVY